MAELRAFYVNPSKILDEPLEGVFGRCVPVSVGHKYTGQDEASYRLIGGGPFSC